MSLRSLMSVLETSFDDGVLTATLNRPEQRNALGDELVTAINELLDRAEAEDELRCLVLRGAEGTFSAGGDLESMKEGLEDHNPASHLTDHREGAHRMISRLFDLHVPTVACIEGAAVGAGLSLALACDIVIATDSAKIGAPFNNVGLVVDMGGSVTLTDAVGVRKAKELLYLGKLIPGNEAAEIGLINRAVPADTFNEQCEEIISELAKGPTVAYSLTKELVHAGVDGDINEALKRETNAQAIAATTQDHREGVEAFLDKRDPEFEGK